MKKPAYHLSPTAMKNICISKSILGIVVVLFALTSSCKAPEEVGREVLNPTEPSDAGSFEDPREKFYGFYKGTNDCNNPAYWKEGGFGFYVKEYPDDLDMVIVEFPYHDIYEKRAWLAKVDKNSLIFDDKIENQPNDCEENSTNKFILGITGTASLNGKTFIFPDFTYTVLDADGEVICVVSCNVNAEKR